jgi:hypothetical protein
MRMTIESTTRMVEADGVKCRVWEGRTDGGIPVVVLIPRIAVKNGNDMADFERELQECKAPSADTEAFPLRMIL